MCRDCTHSLKAHPELGLLIQLAAAELDEKEVSRARRLLAAHRETFDWGRFLDLAARHRLLPLVGRNLVATGVALDDDRRPLTPYRQVFAGAYLGNRVRNEAQHAEYARVLRALEESGILYLVRKGPVLDTYVFRDLGVRQSSDLDLLLERSTMAELTAVLETLGYQQGTLALGGDIRPYSRRTRLYWTTQLNNSLPFVKYSGTIEVDHFKIDPCHGIAQRTSTAQVPNADLFSRAAVRDICGVSVRTLSDSDFLLDLCLHLHKEATSLYYLQVGKGLRLRQLLDIAALTHAWPTERWEELTETARAYDATAEVYYALHFTSRCYPKAVPESVLERIKPDDSAYLDQFGALDKQPEQWRVPFFERMLLNGPTGNLVSGVPRA